MKTVLAALLGASGAAAASVLVPAGAAEFAAMPCSDKACYDNFGHAPMAFCEIAMSKTALGEVATRHESFYANYQKLESGEWAFDLRTETHRASTKFSGQEFDQASGALNFTYLETSVIGGCRRFTGQRLHHVWTERHPYPTIWTAWASPAGFRPGYWSPRAFGGWRW